MLKKQIKRAGKGTFEEHFLQSINQSGQDEVIQ